MSAVVVSAAGHDSHVMPGINSLDVSTDGKALNLLVADYPQGTNPPALLFQRSTDGGSSWTKPVRIDAGRPFPFSPHRGMDAQIAGSGNKLIAIWATGGTGYMGSGPMVTALSSDAGKTWQRGPNPADDNLTTGHAYVDVAADAKGNFHLVWLDSRDGKQGLRYARSSDGGKKWTRNVTLKAESCECCWNTLAVSGDSVHVLFRDKSPRDMAMVSSADGGKTWGKPVYVGAFGWEFQGCPHVGGGLTTGTKGGSALHALVWTGLAGKSGVFHMASTDGGANWLNPVQIGTGDARRSDIATANGQVAVACEVISDGESVVFATKSADGGRTWSELKRLSDKGTTASYPRVVGVGNDFRVFWTETTGHQPGAWKSDLLQ